MKSHLPDERLVFVDLETGGAEPWRPIFEIAAIAVDADLNELETFEARLRFCRHMADPKVLCGSRIRYGQSGIAGRSARMMLPRSLRISSADMAPWISQAAAGACSKSLKWLPTTPPSTASSSAVGSIASVVFYLPQDVCYGLCSGPSGCFTR